jgi:FtsP/CotA-like multicopper oxidase with cupredoxin domain
MKGEALSLAIENKTAFEQPIHVHGHVWRLVEADGSPVDDQPWRDTAVIKAGGTAKLVMVADNPGPWAIQSLIAERSDAGLIGAFRVS